MTNVPPPLLTSEPDSFAQRTIAGRKPAIVRQVLADHAHLYPPEIVTRLENLLAEIETRQPILPLETSAPDGPDWLAAWQPFEGQTWFDIPWYFAETYFYRRLLEATGYFGSESEAVARWQGIDPFLPQKQRELADDTPWQVLNLALSRANDNTDRSFRAMLHHCVWGNRVDLSYNQVAQETGREITVEAEQENLLVDDTEAVLGHLLAPAPSPRRVDFICDNSGTELLLDLALADFLLCFGWAKQVTLHAKFHPFFVSDAMPVDIDWTIAAIRAKTTLPLVAELGQRLAGYRAGGQLSIPDDIYWNSAKFFWEMPPHLREALAPARLVIVKGDANYRRLIGDSRQPTTTPMAEAVLYFPAPLVALRTMKSDAVAGLTTEQVAALDAQDAEWRVNGKRGVIQAVL
jgi:uncharacterized protein with ATP-grasp and redox domains